jgi:hypothetical protein
MNIIDLLKYAVHLQCFRLGHKKDIRPENGTNRAPAAVGKFKVDQEIFCEYEPKSKQYKLSIYADLSDAVFINPSTSEDDDKIKSMNMTRHNPILSVLKNDDDQITLLPYLFSDALAGDLSVGFTADFMLKEMERNKKIKDASAEESLILKLNEEFIFEAEHKPEAVKLQRVFMEWKSDNQFHLYGKEGRLDISRQDDQKPFLISHWIRHDKKIPSDICVLFGDIKFMNEDLAERSILNQKISAINQEKDSYVAVWKRYEEEEAIETNNLKERFGRVPYKSCDPLPGEGEWRFYLKSKTDYSKIRELQLEAFGMNVKNSNDKKSRNYWRGKIIGLHDTGAEYLLDVKQEELDTSPADDGDLELDILGDETKRKRRAHARNTIANNKCGNRVYALGHIITETIWPSRPAGTVQCIPAEIRAMFPNGPTPAQEKAMLYAYNTPDIAIIQGPPGTGKTKIISALARWFALKKSNVEKITLLSSFQHEAVDNLAARCTVFDLPVLRLGKYNSSHNNPFQSWVEAMKEKLDKRRKHYTDIPVFRIRDKVLTFINAYKLFPGSLKNAVQVLNDVLKLIDGVIALSYLEKGKEILRVLEKKSDVKYSARLFAAIYGLRCSPAAFADDGPESCSRLLFQLRRVESLQITEEIVLLEEGENFSSKESPGFLKDLLVLQTRLLDRCFNRQDAAAKETVELDKLSFFFAEVNQALRQECDREIYCIDAVFFQFCEQLETAPERFRQASEKYASVIAATGGQSSGMAMASLIGGMAMARLIVDFAPFENVVIDEAARSNPLDLIIPMTRASKRIILVGDDRQLPHMLEQKIERQVNMDFSDNIQRMLNESLFERIKKHVQNQFCEDGICRYSLLDTQYRMRPALGNLISDAFYEGKVNSGLRDDNFADVIPYGNKAAIWYHLPFNAGGEERSAAKSYFRTCEADLVAKEAEKILRQNPALTVGVITFYKAQELEIKQQLSTRGVLLVVNREYIANPDYANRLQIGTVDAFQGKEFDVVILSTVRSNRHPVDNTSKYGHLMFPGRVCVAMSRQKSLLIVVGDGSMFNSNYAESGVAGLKKLYDFCGGKNAIIQ